MQLTRFSNCQFYSNRNKSHLIARPLATAFNHCLETGVYPDILEKYHRYADKQFGFRKNHSTNLALTFLHEAILKQQDLDNSVFMQSLWILPRHLTPSIIKF